jgi:leader peptidase (prepilin peptidase)/N-methyltransferase
LGAIICGILAAPLLDTTEPWTAVAETIARAGCIAGVLALFRAGYAWSRQTEGLGMGDVKLGGAIGAWLPLEAIPWCFGLATHADDEDTPRCVSVPGAVDRVLYR